MAKEGIINTFHHMFPELKESEGERIRKEIIKYIKTGTYHKSWIAWLEKQGEQKPLVIPKFKKGDFIRLKTNPDDIERVDSVMDDHYILDIKGECNHVLFTCQDLWELVNQKPADKIKPKFKVGDWVVNTVGDTNQVVKVLDDGYTLDDNTFLSNSWATEHYHLWTIQDAKDGDVLATESWLYLFKYTNNKNIIQFHCTCPINVNLLEWHFSFDESYLDIYIDANIRPASKEQRDLLFAKMKEAGYEWDAEKKELKKIEQRIADNIPQDFEKYVEHLLSLSDGEGHGSPAKVKEVSAELFKLAKLEQKPAWSEEDEHRVKDTIYFLDTAKKHYASTIELDACIEWLKSIKDRVIPQSKQE